MRTTTTLPIYVELERGSNEPMAAQLARQLRQAIVQGRLVAGSRLPSSRTLAKLLNVSRPLVQEAYQLLEAEDRIESRRGSGTYVKRVASPGRAAPRPARTAAPAPASPRLVDLSPGLPTRADFPMPVWRAAWRRATHRIPDPPDNLGETALRQAVAAYLRAVRGMAVDPENVLITGEIARSLDLVLSTAARPGDKAAVEDPCVPWLIRRPHRHGVTPLPIPVDDEGAVVSAVPPSAKAVVVCPSHQIPLAVEMSPRRRHRLIEQSAAYGQMIVENDQDHDFTDTIRPQTLWDLSRPHTDEVVYLGTLCGLLPEAVCIGYVVARGRRLGELAERLRTEPLGVGTMIQRATAELLWSIESGTWLGRLRRTYRSKRRMIADLLLGHPAVERVNGVHSGSHVYVGLRPALPAERVADALAGHGITVRTGRDFAWSGLLPPGNGLLIAHNRLTEQALARAMRKIVPCLNDLSRTAHRAYPAADLVPAGVGRSPGRGEGPRTASQSRRSIDR
ncbi:PLP-dependent aminotransferase family protein [Thermopolyspora sp. NPDC052614]|uniref:aminotransferase-like domain-containing protein n=1 Tax=Thermopolyspora sp. NPDC052614 TaxID=3155682 RepID=UPI00342A673D